MEKTVMARETAHRSERVFHKRIPDTSPSSALECTVAVARIVTPVPPRTIEVRPKDDVIEVFDGGVITSWLPPF